MPVDVVLFDFSKAFDMVNHVILLQKLNYIGIRGILVELIRSFLLDRTVYVSVSRAHSSTKPVNSGVPQGSVMGPLLFWLYVNHLPNYIQNPCKFLADNLKMYFILSTKSSTTLAHDITSCQINTVAGSWV